MSDFLTFDCESTFEEGKHSIREELRRGEHYADAEIRNLLAGLLEGEDTID